MFTWLISSDVCELRSLCPLRGISKKLISSGKYTEYNMVALKDCVWKFKEVACDSSMEWVISISKNQDSLICVPFPIFLLSQRKPLEWDSRFPGQAFQDIPPCSAAGTVSPARDDRGLSAPGAPEILRVSHSGQFHMNLNIFATIFLHEQWGQ